MESRRLEGEALSDYAMWCRFGAHRAFRVGRGPDQFAAAGNQQLKYLEMRSPAGPDRTQETSADFVWRKGTVAPVIDYRQTQDGEARPASGWRKRSNGAGRIGRRRRPAERGTSAGRCLAASRGGKFTNVRPSGGCGECSVETRFARRAFGCVHRFASS